MQISKSQGIQPILFLCTGNYYRSRFAEYLFNHKAIEKKLKWRAFSRGIALEYGQGNIGSLSKDAIQELEKRLIKIHNEPSRRPVQVLLEDFEVAKIIIALNKDEHKPMIRHRFPLWEEKVEYWNIPDKHIIKPDYALLCIELEIDRFIATRADGYMS